MNFFKPKHAETPPLPSPPHHPLHQAFTSLQNHLSNFLENFPAPSPIKSPPWARISNQNDGANRNGLFSPNSYKNSSGTSRKKSRAMTTDVMEERLAGVPVYALTNSSKEFVLVTDADTGKRLGLFWFGEADAETLLGQMKSMDSSMSSGYQVVAVELGKLFQQKVNGVALRLVPEASQIKNAVEVRKEEGVLDESISGVPVFQSRRLVLRSKNERYCPFFFRKEDLEKSLARASREQNLVNPSLRRGEIQVAVLEDILLGMKDDSTSTWNDAVFIPPGFDVSSDTSEQ